MGAIGRFLVATAAGAGLGAGGALARRRRPAAEAVQLYGPVPWEEPASEPATPETEPTPPAPQAPPTPPVDAATHVADLEEARARLRKRAAELRAEMEGSPSHG
jgi:hypothetical protein